MQKISMELIDYQINIFISLKNIFSSNILQTPHTIQSIYCNELNQQISFYSVLFHFP